jgi:hypothetical protein
MVSDLSRFGFTEKSLLAWGYYEQFLHARSYCEHKIETFYAFGFGEAAKSLLKGS